MNNHKNNGTGNLSILLLSNSSTRADSQQVKAFVFKAYSVSCAEEISQWKVRVFKKPAQVAPLDTQKATHYTGFNRSQISSLTSWGSH